MSFGRFILDDMPLYFLRARSRISSIRVAYSRTTIMVSTALFCGGIRGGCHVKSDARASRGYCRSRVPRALRFAPRGAEV